MANLRRSTRIEAQRQRRIAARQGENEEDPLNRQRQESLARRRERYAADRGTTQRYEALAGRRERYRRLPSFVLRMRRLNDDCQSECVCFFFNVC